MKHKILRWLFKSYARELRQDASRSVSLQMEAFKATLDIKDAIRERFKGVRPQHPDSDTLLATHMAGLDNPSLLGFLAKAKQVIDNETFQIVALSLMLESIDMAALHSPDMSHVNFNRATVNGVQLLEDTMEMLAKQYKEQDELNRKMTEEERLSAL